MTMDKGRLTQLVLKALRADLDDPVVEITETKANLIRVRVGQDRGGPRYFNIKISEEV